MARGDSSRRRPARPGARATPPKTTRPAKKPSTRAGASARDSARDSAPRAPLAEGPFRLGAVPGATPGKWIDTWQRRMPDNPLEFIPLTVAGQRDALETGEVDAAIVRLPIDRGGLGVIALYDETPVVVCAADSHLTAADELTRDDLDGEVVIVPRDDVLGTVVPGAVAPVFAPPETTEDAVATVATGVGILIVPMSLARLHHRKDVTFRPLADGPVSPVALAWRSDATTPLVETFIGIVRGRTANSSR